MENLDKAEGGKCGNVHQLTKIEISHMNRIENVRMSQKIFYSVLNSTMRLGSLRERLTSNFRSGGGR